MDPVKKNVLLGNYTKKYSSMDLCEKYELLKKFEKSKPSDLDNSVYNTNTVIYVLLVFKKSKEPRNEVAT